MPAFKKQLLLQIGPIQTAVDLHTVKEAAETSIRRVCPDHLIPLKQRVVCEEDEKVFGWGEWADAVPGPDGWRVVHKSEKPSVDASSSLTLIPMAAQDVRDNTFEGENMYYCKPSSEPFTLTWHILNRAMKPGKTLFMARGALRAGREKLWKYELFRGYPILREVVFPDAIKPQPDTDMDFKIDKETQNLVSTFIDSTMSSWDQIDTTDSFKAAFDKWVGAGNLVQVKAESPDTTNVEDMIKNLQNAVKAATK